MANDEIDLDRVLVDPAYRREVIEYLNATAGGIARDGRRQPPGSDAVSRPAGPSRR